MGIFINEELMCGYPDGFGQWVMGTWSSAIIGTDVEAKFTYIFTPHSCALAVTLDIEIFPYKIHPVFIFCNITHSLDSDGKASVTTS